MIGGKIRGCIFDLGGTIVDRYSIISLLSFKQLFSERGISINNNILLNYYLTRKAVICSLKTHHDF